MFMRSEEVSKFRPKSIADLANSKHRSAVDSAAWYGQEFANLRNNNPTFEARLLKSNSLDIKFEWLEKNRVDIVISDLYFGHYLLRRSGKSASISTHLLLINMDDIHFMFSKKAFLRPISKS